MPERYLRVSLTITKNLQNVANNQHIPSSTNYYTRFYAKTQQHVKPPQKGTPMCDDTILGIKPDTIYEANPSTLRQWARNIHDTYPYEQAYGQFIRVIIHDEEPTKYEGEV